MIVDDEVKIRLTKDEVSSFNTIFKAFGISGDLNSVLEKACLVLEGGDGNSRRLLKVFHPSFYMVLPLTPGKENEPLRLSPNQFWFSVSLRGLKELVNHLPGKLEDHFSASVLEKALIQNAEIKKYYKTGRSVKIRLFLQKKLPFLKLYPPKRLVKASENLEKSGVLNEIMEKLPGYLESGSLKRVLIDRDQIHLGTLV